ncbi:MAG: NAD(P)/FAD-dependent oxidoreductase [Patescibacteria group bacterium]|nr:NAD(P)/FAD-dependent oxidoreductase [Patescibacteria group bacterium]MBU1877229.1 NAD(P)/FAD-dependent oxidoreductase [Patescibacteria group bacterium]
MFKTIIIGAGPAGLIAGKYLDNSLILDKKKEIGKPVQCGEGLSQIALSIQGITPDPAWISTFIQNIEVIVPSGKKIILPGQDAGYVLDRVAFEKFLATQCQAEIKLESKVVDLKREKDCWAVYTEKGDIYRAQYIIGADGPLSVTRTKLFGGKFGILPTYEYLVELEKEVLISTIRLYFDKEKYPDGYVWIFPKSKHTANIGLGGYKELDKRFKYFMDTTVVPEFGNYKLLTNKSGLITYGGMRIKLFKDNVFLVGDAGALIDPVLGGGINNAMISGRLATEAILNNSSHLFEKKLKSMSYFSEDLMYAQKVLYSLPNSVLNEIADISENKNPLDLKNLSGLVKFFSKSKLRSRAWQLFKLFSILQRSGTSFG